MINTKQLSSHLIYFKEKYHISAGIFKVKVSKMSNVRGGMSLVGSSTVEAIA